MSPLAMPVQAGIQRRSRHRTAAFAGMGDRA